MGQTMFRGSESSDSIRKKSPLLPLSLARHNEEDDINVSFFVWFRQLFVSIAARFRFGALKPLPEPNQPHPINSNYNDNQHCVVDVVEIEEPISENTAIRGDAEGEIGIEKSVVVQEQKLLPVPLPLPSTKGKSKKKKKQSGTLGPYSREQSILLVGEGDFSFSASTVIGGNEDDEIGIERSVMEVEEVQKEEEEPVPVQPPATKSEGKSKKKKKKQSGSFGPYSREQSILLVGEGDFSFSASLAVAFGDAPNIVATSLNSFKFLKKNYANAATNITELTSRDCKVIHGVDATKMARHPELRSLKFDCIVYNFPHAGFGNRKASREEQISLHQALVKGFLKNAKKMIKEEDGQIHITHKCIGFFLEWGLETLGSSQGLRLVQETPFNLKHYPGYSTKYGYGGDGDFDWKPSKTYIFQLST